MTIGPGDRIPEATLLAVSADQPAPVETGSFFAGRTVVLFGVPGAFTPTCTARHLPGFLEEADRIRERGATEIACVAVNDPFVMAAWAREQGVEGRVTMLSDGSGTFTHALGLELDLKARGFGVRSKRYAMIARDGVVAYLGVEPGTEVGVSSAAAILDALG